MADIQSLVDGGSGEASIWPEKVRDLGDGTYAPSVVDEGALSSQVSVTSFSDASMATLVGAVNTHLSTSTDRLIDVTFLSDGTSTPTFYALVTEHTI